MIWRKSPMESGSRRAFSLIELLVVMAIIAVATTGAVVIYSRSLQTAPLQAAAERSKSLLVNARSYAIAEESPSRIVFDLTNDQVWIDTLDAAGELRQPKVVHPVLYGPQVVIQEVRIAGVAHTEGIVTARFEPTGVGPLISIHLRREADDATVDENYYTVRLWPNSGAPKVTPRARR